MHRVLILGASGSGKTTVGRELARRLGVPFIEADALNHGPNWTEARPNELRERVVTAMGDGGWVIDNDYRRKLGDLVSARADTIVWLDLPLPLTQWRLLRRTTGRILRREELWNGNRESWRGAFVGRESLLAWAIRSHFRYRRTMPERVAAGRRSALVRLRTSRAVRKWLAVVGPPPG